jgi:hypothetical protein
MNDKVMTISPYAWRLAASLAVAALLACGQGIERLSLPQQSAVLRLPAESVAAALQLSTGQTLSAAAEHPLIRTLPASMQNGCRAMIAAWGENPANTPQWGIRVLLRQPDGLWLALRCQSADPHVRQYYDERLAFVRPSSSTMQFLPFDRDAAADSRLFHVELGERLPVQGFEAIAFRVTADSDNPCCGGGDVVREQWLRLYVVSEPGVDQALSVLTLQDQQSHDDEHGDSRIVRVTQVDFERNAAGAVVAALTRSREEADGKLRGTGSARYRWDSKARRFVAMP